MRALLDVYGEAVQSEADGPQVWVVGVRGWEAMREHCARELNAAGKFLQAYRMRRLDRPPYGLEVLGIPVFPVMDLAPDSLVIVTASEPS